MTVVNLTSLIPNMSKRTENIFAIFESKEEKFPGILKYVLEECGFESLSSLKNINSDSIGIIENHINQNGYILENEVFNNSPYMKQQNFKFLPGHKLLLLELPQRISEYQSKSNKNKLQNQTSISNVSAENNENNQNVINVNAKEDELKAALIQRISTSTTGIYFKINHENTSIKTFNVNTFNNQVSCKSSVACPVCNKACSVTFKKYWYISNFEKHLKQHIKEQVESTRTVARRADNDSIVATSQADVNVIQNSNDIAIKSVPHRSNPDLDTFQDECSHPVETLQNNSSYLDIDSSELNFSLYIYLTF